MGNTCTVGGIIIHFQASDPAFGRSARDREWTWPNFALGQRSTPLALCHYGFILSVMSAPGSFP
jgi:hypothetical protein